MTAGEVQEYDDFGLPIRRYVSPAPPTPDDHNDDGTTSSAANGAGGGGITGATLGAIKGETVDKEKGNRDKDKYKEESGATTTSTTSSRSIEKQEKQEKGAAEGQDGVSKTQKTPPLQSKLNKAAPSPADNDDSAHTKSHTESHTKSQNQDTPSSTSTSELPSQKPTDETIPPISSTAEPNKDNTTATDTTDTTTRQHDTPKHKSSNSNAQAIAGPSLQEVQASKQAQQQQQQPQPKEDPATTAHARGLSVASLNKDMSEYSHQQLTAPKEEKKEDDEGWQTMPAYAPYDIYDDDNKLVAKEHNVDEDERYAYAGLGGAGKGYTRVVDDDDAESETSMDDNTRYLFNTVKSTSMSELDDDQRDAVSQLQATKDLLTEGQRIAYVGITRLELVELVKAAETMDPPKKVKKEVQLAAEALKMWSQKIMIRLYAHMEISQAEQVMIEQLAEHGVMPRDLTPALMQNARVKNPMAEKTTPSTPSLKSPISPRQSISSSTMSEPSTPAPPPYESHDGEDMPEVQTPSQLPHTAKIDIDIRWTVLCDLFLVLIADSVYDARSRVLLERVGKDLEVAWIDICRFEKRVTDSLEMQQQAEKENWNEEEHLEARRKMALKRRYVMMGLATVGGGLVIGLSAGLMAPLIGAGLATGFTAIGVGGTSSFLAGAGGAAIITSGAAASGSYMGGRAANRRTGAVKTFEYRPLHNNKRVNLIVTISGWMSSKVDDVRLPFSTVDPVMGDIYSILWEPEMLTSMGDTINILATEAVTQSLQQVLGATVLMSLMAALQLPIVLSKLSYLVDNPWTVSLDRAWAAGLVLADSLIDRSLGTRPITLVGYSLGARVIFSCMLELARKGAFGLVQNVYMFGSPIVVKPEEYLKCRTVIAGRWVNGYNKTDWILGYLFRLTNGGIRRVAGLATVENVPGLENVECSEFVKGHMDYRSAMPKLLRKCGWIVESDEFVEIEDPDPDNHEKRQREIINEIEEARRELEAQENAKKGGGSNTGGWGGIFGRKKKATRAEWEVYEDKRGPAGGDPTRTEDRHGNNHGVLFDVDAIRAELAKEQEEKQEQQQQQKQEQEQELQPRELQSTLPPMVLQSPSSSSSLRAPRDSSLRETRSAHGALEYGGGGGGWDRSPRNNNYADDDGDDGIQMTFDTAFQESPRAAPPAGLYGGNANSSSAVSSSAAIPSSSTAPRPEFKSANTAPNVALKDPWADLDYDDDDDDDFGKEKEISMTFA